MLRLNFTKLLQVSFTSNFKISNAKYKIFVYNIIILFKDLKLHVRNVKKHVNNVVCPVKVE